jgi:denticleless
LRLKCYREDAYHGVSANINAVDYNPKPPIFACKFSSTTQYAQVIALVNEDGKLALQDTTIKYKSQDPLEGIQVFIIALHIHITDIKFFI